jgi:hypothetical protein
MLNGPHRVLLYYCHQKHQGHDESGRRPSCCCEAGSWSIRVVSRLLKIRLLFQDAFKAKVAVSTIALDASLIAL